MTHKGHSRTIFGWFYPSPR